MNHVWIIEELCNGVWFPLVGTACLSRADARWLLNEKWKPVYPKDKFRIRKYVSE